MADEEDQKPAVAKPRGDDDPKNSSSYSDEVKPTHYTHVPGKGFHKDAFQKDEEQDPERKITIYQRKLASTDGYLKKFDTKKYHKEKDGAGKFGSYTSDAGLLHYDAEAVSEFSFDIDKKEWNVTAISANADFSIAHAKAEGTFKLGAWIKCWFGGEESKQSAAGTPGVASLMAARVGDLTGHGSPLAPGIGSPNVFIGYMPAWRATADFHACPNMKGPVPDLGGMVAVGSPTVFINHVNACRVGDMVVEMPGGPNPIAKGCPTVFIGSTGAKNKLAGAESDGVVATGKIEGDFAVFHGDVDASLVISKDKPKVSVNAGLMFSLFKGAIEGGITIPLWGKHSITIKGKAEGSVGSIGLDGHFEATWSKKEGYHSSWGIGGALGMGGSLGLSLGIK